MLEVSGTCERHLSGAVAIAVKDNRVWQNVGEPVVDAPRRLEAHAFVGGRLNCRVVKVTLAYQTEAAVAMP